MNIAPQLTDTAAMARMCDRAKNDPSLILHNAAMYLLDARRNQLDGAMDAAMLLASRIALIGD